MDEYLLLIDIVTDLWINIVTDLWMNNCYGAWEKEKILYLK